MGPHPNPSHRSWFSVLLSHGQATDHTSSRCTPVFPLGEVICEPPNNKLDKFKRDPLLEGEQVPPEQPEHAAAGLVLRNTVVFRAGHLCR